MNPFANISKAVFPVAGLGTRFLPATKAQPKEMLPVVDKPLIQYAVEEAYASGCRHMIFVTGRNKRAIEDHFDLAYELEYELQAQGRDALLQAVRSVQPRDMVCSYVRQPRSLGLGHAIWCARHLIGHDAFAVLLADDLMTAPPGGAPVLAQLMEQAAQLQASVIAVQEVAEHEVSSYGIVAGEAVSEQLLRVRHLVEKPARADAPSRLAIAGRYVLSPQVLHHLTQLCALRDASPAPTGEVQLTHGIAALRNEQPVYAWRYSGQRYDCGSKAGFLRATVELGLAHPEVGAAFAQYLAQRTQPG